jgi:hypothetical protein
MQCMEENLRKITPHPDERSKIVGNYEDGVT